MVLTTTVSVFYDKAVLLAVEAEFFSHRDRPIDKDLAIIILHQAVEMGLKAFLLMEGKNIHEKGSKTINFSKILEILRNKLGAEIFNLFVILNNIRNNLQHYAFLSIPDEPKTFVNDFVKENITALNKILPKHPKMSTFFGNLIDIEIGSQTYVDSMMS